MASVTLASLRAATRSHHERLDAGLSFPEALASRTGRRRMAGRFYGWQAGVERALGDLLSDIEGLELETRLRAAGFDADLRALELDMAGLPICPVPAVRTPGEAMGLLYVVEGSTLGGKVIRQRVRAGGGDLEGLGFLDPYGVRTGEMWRAFLGVLEREACSDGVRGDVVRGGVMGFEQAELWLNPALAAA